jgi:hypothetical protein
LFCQACSCFQVDDLTSTLQVIALDATLALAGGAREIQVNSNLHPDRRRSGLTDTRTETSVDDRCDAAARISTTMPGLPDVMAGFRLCEKLVNEKENPIGTHKIPQQTGTNVTTWL